MGYTLEQLASDIRETLTAKSAGEARGELVALVEKALTDESFLDANVRTGQTEPRRVIYEDP